MLSSGAGCSPMVLTDVDDYDTIALWATWQCFPFSVIKVLTMVCSIPSDLEQFVQQQLATGEYRSQDEVVAAGLLVLRELKRRQAEFRQEVQVGVDQLDRGEGIKIAATELRAFFDDVQARGQQRYEASKNTR